MNNIQFDDSDDLIDIRYDNVFKAVFTSDTPKSRTALSDLISVLIGQKISVSAITTNELPVSALTDRQIRFDISCKTADGHLISVEMSLNPDRCEPVRLEFYAGKLFTGQDIRGTERGYKDLQEAYLIALLAKGRFFDDEAFLHTFRYYDPERDVSLEGRSRIITVELAKAGKVMNKPVTAMTDYEKWAVYFRYLTDRGKREKINEILREEEGIAMASEVLIHISRDEIERARLLSEYKYQLDTQSHLVTARWEGRQKGLRKGRKEGRAEGIAERNIEIARKLKGIDVPLEKIQTATGLSLEIIEKL